MPTIRSRTRIRRGMALREIVVLVLVLGALLLLLAPYLQQRRAQHRRLTCERRQVELAQALLRHEARREGFPGYRNLQAMAVGEERMAGSWVFPILPFIGYDDKAERPGPWAPVHMKYGESGADEHRGRPPTVVIPDLICPADTLPNEAAARAGWLSFVANAGMPDAEPSATAPADWPANGVFHDLFTLSETGAAVGERVTLADVEDHDGAAHTLLLSENIDAARWTDTSESQVGFVWVDGMLDEQPSPGERLLRINERRGQGDGSLRFARPSSYHAGGATAVFCDSSMQFINEQIDYLVLVRLMTPNDRQLKAPGEDRLLEPPYRIVEPMR